VSEVEDGGVIKADLEVRPNDILIARYSYDPHGIKLMGGCRGGTLEMPVGTWLEFPQGTDQPFSRDDLVRLDEEKRLKVIAVAKSLDGQDLHIYGNWMFINPPTMLVGVWTGAWDGEKSYVKAAFMDLTIFALGK
jgi:hypothetical protein